MPLLNRRHCKRLTGKKHVRLMAFLDPRCYLTLWKLQRLLQKKRGVPYPFSKDYALSELLVHPERGWRLLKEACDVSDPMPANQKPRANRFDTRSSKDPEGHYEPGPPDEDWAVDARRATKKGDEG